MGTLAGWFRFLLNPHHSRHITADFGGVPLPSMLAHYIYLADALIQSDVQ